MFIFVGVFFLTVQTVTCEGSLTRLYCGKITGFFVFMLEQCDEPTNELLFIPGLFPLLWHRCWAGNIGLRSLLRTPWQDHLLFQAAWLSDSKCVLLKPHSQSRSEVSEWSINKFPCSLRNEIRKRMNHDGGGFIYVDLLMYSMGSVTQWPFSVMPFYVYRCNGKNSCTISASNSVFGDPCYGTYKYLEVSYVCDCKYLFSSVSANSQSSHTEFLCRGVEKCKIHTEYSNNLTTPLFSTLLQILSPSLHKHLWY